MYGNNNALKLWMLYRSQHMENRKLAKSYEAVEKQFDHIAQQWDTLKQQAKKV